VFDELGLELVSAQMAPDAALVELLADDADAAEGLLRPAYEELVRAGARADLQLVGAYLAQAMYSDSCTSTRATWSQRSGQVPSGETRSLARRADGSKAV
jgi:hypothetical protein